MAKKSKPKQKRNTERLSLPHGCTSTLPYISPNNWDSSRSSSKETWYLRYTFYDPIRRPQGFAVNWEGGVNEAEHVTWEARRDVAKQILKDTTEALKEGYNPIIREFTTPSLPFIEPSNQQEAETKSFLTPDTAVIDCLKWAYSQIGEETGTKKDMRNYLHHIFPGLMVIRYDKIPVKEITPQHVLHILEAASKITSRWDEKKKKDVPLKWSNYKYNKTLDYLSMLFRLVGTLKITTANPCHGLEKKRWGKKPKVALTEKECIAIDKALSQNEPRYHRFIKIFFTSGSRKTEMMKIQGRDVLLDQDVFYRWVMKRKSKEYEQIRTTIPQSAKHLWQELLRECRSPDNYLFGRGFQPGKEAIGVDNINTYWAEFVQKPLGIKQGPYILKSMYLTALKKKYGSGTAAVHAAHKSEEMIDEVYDLDKDESEHKRIREANISFAPHMVGLPASAHCSTTSVPASMFLSRIRIPCTPCLASNIAPAKYYRPLQAA